MHFKVFFISIITTKDRVVLFHGLDQSSRVAVRVVRSDDLSNPETLAKWSWAEWSTGGDVRYSFKLLQYTIIINEDLRQDNKSLDKQAYKYLYILHPKNAFCLFGWSWSSCFKSFVCFTCIFFCLWTGCDFDTWWLSWSIEKITSLLVQWFLKEIVEKTPCQQKRKLSRITLLSITTSI